MRIHMCIFLFFHLNMHVEPIWGYPKISFSSGLNSLSKSEISFTLHIIVWVQCLPDLANVAQLGG